ncbi:regulatory protein, tetR family [Thermomonospora echinospora]|uniref:Regulatory protein, tetR family n=1 Tax=Thermomonospora echinospora TaxID=1992 RepID=A0A1H5SYJ1_9ACTN|nr:TetR/AcrR family transcriptional regulator [Thermomonospora echinospora]SEF55682.1 regulatory protein, tetR family [Thermomonospora echinospora]
MPTEQATEKARIVEAAHRCLVDSDGVTASVTGILTTAGLSTRAFYRHFESKDGLLLAMFREDADRVTAELRAAAAAAPTPGEALRQLIHGMLRLTAEAPRRRRILVLVSEEAQRARGYAAEHARFRAAQEATIAEILRAGLADGSFPWADPEPDARSIRAALGQAFMEQMLQTAEAGPAEAAEQVTRFAFRALGAEGP